MDSIAERLDRVVDDLARAVRDDAVTAPSDDDRMHLLRAAGRAQRLLDAVVLETVAGADGRPAGSGDVTFPARFGCRTMNDLLQRVLGLDAPSAARTVKAARAVRRETEITTGAPLPPRWPALREALHAGAIGTSGLLAATGPVEQAGARIGTADRLRADAELAEHARGCALADADRPYVAAPPATAEDLRVLSQVIVMHLDPDGAEPADERAMRERGVVLGRTKNGVIPVHWSLLPEVAGQLQRIWDAYLNPKVDGPPLPGPVFRPSDETLDDDVPGGLAEGSEPIDPRTRAQKQHDALAAALGIAARHDETPSLGGAAPTLVVSVDASDYATGRGWAHIDGIDAPVPVSVAAHTACAGTVQRVLFDPEGRIIGIGTSDRVFGAHQRRAIALRDGECLIPGCHVPATWCEIHHVTEHARGGQTHTDNGVALCWHHHRTLHTSGWQIRTQNGMPQIRGPAWWDPTGRWREPRPTLSSRLRRRA